MSVHGGVKMRGMHKDEDTAKVRQSQTETVMYTLSILEQGQIIEARYCMVCPGFISITVTSLRSRAGKEAMVAGDNDP